MLRRLLRVGTSVSWRTHVAFVHSHSTKKNALVNTTESSSRYFGFLNREGKLVSSSEDILLPEIALWDFLKGVLYRKSDTTAIECGITGRSYTFQELIDISESIASGLQEIGVKPGQVITVFLPNVPEFAAFLLGVTRLGAVFSPVNANSTIAEFRHFIRVTNSEVVITDCQSLPVIYDSLASFSHVITIDEEDNDQVHGNCITMKQLIEKAGKKPPEEPVINPVTATALLPFSSGTTGPPKAVMLTHHNIVSNVLQIRSSPHLYRPPKSLVDHQLISLGVLPFNHTYALVCVLILSLHLGGKVITLPHFSPSAILSVFQKYKFGALNLVPTLATLLLEYIGDVSQYLEEVVQITCGGDLMNRKLAKQITDLVGHRVKFTEGYGLTETSPAITMCGDRPGSVGQLVANTQAMVVDTETKETLGPRKEGELYVKGPQVMKGYYNNVTATMEAFEKGWLKTGDMAWYDDEDYFYITGRVKETIKVRGEQVSPSELERLLLAHEDVAEACVVGIPDDYAVELPKAYIVTTNTNLTEEDIKSFLHPKVSKFKYLDGGVEFLESLPKNPVGKVFRRKLMAADKQKEE